MANVLNIRPSDVVIVAVQEGDGSCLILSTDSPGSQPDFEKGLAVAAEQAANTGKGILIVTQSVSALRKMLLNRAETPGIPTELA